MPPRRKKGRPKVKDTDLPELEPLKQLRIYLRNANSQGRFPRESLLANKSVGACLRILGEWREKCVCPKEASHGVWNLCPACQRAKLVLGVWVKVEDLRVRWGQVEERLLQGLIRERSLNSAKRLKSGDSPLAGFDYGGLIRAVNDKKAVERDPKFVASADVDAA